METNIAFHPNHLVKRMLQIQLVLLLLCAGISPLAAQEHSTVAAVSSVTADTSLVTQLMKDARKRGVAPDSAQKMLSQALVLAKKHGLKKKVGIIWNMMGNRALQKGDFTNCQHYLDSGFTLNEELKDAELTCVLNTLAARMYQFETNYAKAASHYFRAIHAIQENDIHNPRSVAQLYHSLGGLMISLDEDSLARHYLQLAEENALQVRPLDSAFVSNILMTLAQAHEGNDPRAAVDYFKEAYTTAQQYNFIPLSYTVLVNLTTSYIELGMYDSAEHYLQLTESVTQPGGSQEKTESVAGLLAFLKKDYNQSIMHLEKAMSLAHGEEDEHLEEIYNVLSQVYAARGAYPLAYEYHKKYMDQYRRHTDGQKKIVADFMLNFQALDHEKQIMQKQVEISARDVAIKRQQFWITAMGVCAGLLLIILALAYRNYQNKKSLLNQKMLSLLQEQEIERLKAEAEGEDKERTRIAYDLHDGVLVRLANVKMNLSGLSGLVMNDHYQDVIGQLETATTELRNTAHNLMPEILLEDGLAQAIFYFCKATEQASGLTIKFQQVGTPFPKLVPQAEVAVYRIVQGLLQNIVQHADATTALIQLQYANQLCSITVEDNGQGIHSENQEGYGLKSIRNRVKILNGTFDIETEKGHGTTVYFEFDVQPFLLHTSAAQRAV